MDIKKTDFEKGGGVVPAVIQDVNTGMVLMLGYMNRDSLEKTIMTGQVTFYSRSRKRLWKKGEESGNFLFCHQILSDCDHDTLLILAEPAGPVCHNGTDTCFGQSNSKNISFINKLEDIIRDRKRNPEEKSYTSSLFRGGPEMISRKVGEEAIELILEVKGRNETRFLEESADLLFHFMVLLENQGTNMSDVCEILRQRHKTG